MKKLISALLVAGAATAVAVYVIAKNKEEKTIISKDELELDDPEVDSDEVQSDSDNFEDNYFESTEFVEPEIETVSVDSFLPQEEDSLPEEQVEEETFYHEVEKEIFPTEEKTEVTSEEAHQFYDEVTHEDILEEDAISEIEIPSFMSGGIERTDAPVEEENSPEESSVEIEEEQPQEEIMEEESVPEEIQEDVIPNEEVLVDTSELEVVQPEPEEELVEIEPEPESTVLDNHELDLEEVETEKPHFIAESSIGEVQSSSILSDVRYPYLDEATILDLKRQVEDATRYIPQGKEVLVQHQVLYFDNEFLLVLIRELKKQGYTMLEDEDHVSLQIKLLNDGDEILKNVLKISNRVHSDFSLYKGFKIIEE